MSLPGAGELRVQTRAALLDALEALGEHRENVVVIGAQAVYLHTGEVRVAIPEETKDADLAIDPRGLADDPLLEEAMRLAGFDRPLINPQPGAWQTAAGIPVDLMVPHSGTGGSAAVRGGRIRPHAKDATRRARGVDAVLVDNVTMEIAALDPHDPRVLVARVAGPGALIVAKMHKIADRMGQQPGRLNDKDAHDVYRLLRAVPAATLAAALQRSLADRLSAEVTQEAIGLLEVLFAAGADAEGSVMAGRTEEGVGNPEGNWSGPRARVVQGQAASGSQGRPSVRRVRAPRSGTPCLAAVAV